MKPYKYTVILKNNDTFNLLNPTINGFKNTAEQLIDKIVEKGVSYKETSGNITWYPPHQIKSIYFDFDK